VSRVKASEERIATLVFRHYRQVRSSGLQSEQEILKRTAVLSLSGIGCPSDHAASLLRVWFGESQAFPTAPVSDARELASLILTELRPIRDSEKFGKRSDLVDKLYDREVVSKGY
jgi:hypothetical protein